jgi:uncharacterized protein
MQMRMLAVVVGSVAAVFLTLACSTRSKSAAPTAVATAPPSALTGKFVWHDLVTEDPEACRRFYGALLGWEFEDTRRGDRPYILARAGGRYVAGIVAVPPDASQELSQWLGYMSVPDVDAAAAKVTQAGGRALVAPREVGSIGRAAVVLDPQGAPVGLLRLAAGDPADEASPILGRFFWMEYLAKEPDAALSFYKDLAGYESQARETPAGTPYQVLTRERPRAGLMKSPIESVRPNWLSYVRVEDPAALAGRVVSLGGKVVVAPRTEIRNGTLAVVADPSGAVLALQKWPL